MGGIEKVRGFRLYKGGINPTPARSPPPLPSPPQSCRPKINLAGCDLGNYICAGNAIKVAAIVREPYRWTLVCVLNRKQGIQDALPDYNNIVMCVLAVNKG